MYMYIYIYMYIHRFSWDLRPNKTSRGRRIFNKIKYPSIFFLVAFSLPLLWIHDVECIIVYIYWVNSNKGGKVLKIGKWNKNHWKEHTFIDQIHYILFLKRPPRVAMHRYKRCSKFTIVRCSVAWGARMFLISSMLCRFAAKTSWFTSPHR